MRYYTEEKYIDLQREFILGDVEPDPRAAQFSEELFRELYSVREAEHLEWHREYSEMLLEAGSEYYKSDSPDFDVCGRPINPDDPELAREYQRRIRENYRHTPPAGFDPDVSRDVFHHYFEVQIARARAYFPQEILDQVADIRVLALDRAVPELCKRIHAWSETFRIRSNAAGRARDAAQIAAFWKGKPYFVSKLGECHDDHIGSFTRVGKDCFLAAEHTIFRFVNAEVLKQDGPLEGLTFLYYEVYPIAKGYEIHILLLNDDYDFINSDTLTDLILQCEDVIASCPYADI